MSVRIPLTLAALLFIQGPLARSAEAPADPAALREAWQASALNLFKDANHRFADLTGREARFGEAVTLLQVQPKTASNINRSASLLEQVRADNPGDELGIAALYHLGRLEQVHRMPVNPAAAIAHFNTLIQDHPGHPFTEQAITKLAIIELYAPDNAARRPAVFERFTALADTLVTSDARRDLNLTLGNAALRFGLGDERALERYLIAEQAGIHLTTVRSSTLVTIGELARKLGRHDIAREHYQLFLKDFQRDDRRLMVKEALATLPSKEDRS